jgi:serine/threonine-protein kinase
MSSEHKPPVDDSATDLERGVFSPLKEVPLTRGTILAGRYALERVIGRGGMGVVVKAHDRTLGEAVAIKILRAEYSDERRWAERLAREVKLARQIHHPNVCRVFDFEQADGRAFVVMELASGGNLRDEIRGGYVQRTSIESRISDAQAIARGLGAIHQAGIVHRDLTPQNVLRMADGRLVVSDFGLWRRIRRRRRRASTAGRLPRSAPSRLGVRPHGLDLPPTGTEFTWVETDADSGRPTGRTVPGSRECSDGVQDPESPSNRGWPSRGRSALPDNDPS